MLPDFAFDFEHFATLLSFRRDLLWNNKSLKRFKYQKAQLLLNSKYYTDIAFSCFIFVLPVHCVRNFFTCNILTLCGFLHS